jgi:hypothetical protein
MPRSEDNRSRSAHVMPPHRWRSARILEAVCQVNLHLVSTLIELARDGNVSTVVVAQNVDALCRLEEAACNRVARIPVLLLDLHFQDEDWWRNATRSNGDIRAATIGTAGLPADYAAELTRETLIVAWLAVHQARQSASLLFGMSDAVASLLGELTPQQLNRVAEQSSHELSIRWQMKPDFWRRLLAAAQSGNAVDLSEIHLLGLHLLGGELMSVR